MIIQKIECDVCGHEILKRKFNNDDELKNSLIDNVNEIQIGNEVVVEDCCDDCAIKIKNYIQITKEHLINEGNLSND